MARIFPERILSANEGLKRTMDDSWICGRQICRFLDEVDAI